MKLQLEKSTTLSPFYLFFLTVDYFRNQIYTNNVY